MDFSYMKHLLFFPDDRIEYTSCGKFVCKEGGATHPRRTLDSFVLLLGSSGGYRISEGGTEYDLTAGKFLLLFPGDEHFGTTACAPGLSHYWCHFRLPTDARHKILEAPQGGEARSLLLPTYGEAPSTERARMLFHQLIDTARRGGPCCDSLCNMTLMLLLSELASPMSKGNATAHNAATAAKVAEWIRLYITDIGSAKDVAAHFGYNCEYLTTALRLATGKPLTEHIRDARIAEAKNLLLCSDLSVKEIAYRCGFSDEKYFLKVFRGAADMTPGQYRNAFVHMHYNKR